MSVVDVGKIVFLTCSLGYGGSERQLYYILRELKHHGTEVEVVSLTTGEFWQAEIEKLGIEVKVVRARSKLGRLLKILDIVRRQHPRVVYAMQFYTNLYAAVVGRALGAHTVGSVRNDGWHELKDTGRMMGTLCCRLPHVIVANSVHGAENIRRIFGRTSGVRILRNVIDTECFVVSPKRAGEQVALLLVARLVEQKRVHLFIQLLSRLYGAGKSVRAVVVGHGPLQTELEQLAASLLPHGLLQLAGCQPDVRPWLADADILVSTSGFEGTSNILMEAMACGLPVLTLGHEGVEQLIEHGVVGMVAADDEDLFEYGCQMIDNEGMRRRMGAAGRRFVEQKCAISGLVQEFLLAIRT